MLNLGEDGPPHSPRAVPRVSDNLPRSPEALGGWLAARPRGALLQQHTQPARRAAPRAALPQRARTPGVGRPRDAAHLLDELGVEAVLGAGGLGGLGRRGTLWSRPNHSQNPRVLAYRRYIR